LECAKETYQLLDFYHVTEHLQTFAEAAFSEKSEQKYWFKKARNILKKGLASNLILEMNQLIFNAPPEQAKTLIVQRDYLVRANVENRLNYAYISEQKLPIGSGAIESLIRQVVNLRMKGNSKFWLKANAEWIAGSWDNFWNSIFTSFLNPQISG